MVRSAMMSPHTTGRCGVARTSEQLKGNDPSRVVTRTESYIASHSRRDGTYPTEELVAQLEAIRSITSSDASSTGREIDHDPVAAVCGDEHRGRIRGMGGGVSRRSLTASGPAREHLRQEEARNVSLQDQINHLDGMQNRMQEELDGLRRQWMAQASQGSASGSTETPSSARRSSLPTQSSPMEQMCDLLHPGHRVVGVDRVVTGGDGLPAPDGFCRIIVDTASEPNAYPLCLEDTPYLLGDLVGVHMLWPTCFIRLRH